MNGGGTLLGWSFEWFARHHLLYNACFEDAAVDREALELGPADRVVVIGSGGCNALDYLLAGAGAVEAVDANPCQTALLELKVAALRTLDHAAVWELFGEGRSPRAPALYARLRPLLSPGARHFWDRKLGYFSGRGLRPSLYWRGGWGAAMWAFVTYWKRIRRLRDPFERMFAAPDVDTQRRIYENELADRLWTPALARLASQPWVLMVMGIPARQRVTILSSPGGMYQRGIDALDQITRRPLATNPYLRVYERGAYAPDACPTYLSLEGFTALRDGRLDRLFIHTSTLVEHLERPGPPIDRFVLLDHLDWLGPADLARTFGAIFRRAAPGARVLVRSAGFDIDWLWGIEVPGRRAPLRDLARPDPRAAVWHAQDRVGFYGSFHVLHLEVR